MYKLNFHSFLSPLSILAICVWTICCSGEDNPVNNNGSKEKPEEPQEQFTYAVRIALFEPNHGNELPITTMYSNSPDTYLKVWYTDDKNSSETKDSGWELKFNDSFFRENGITVHMDQRHTEACDEEVMGHHFTSCVAIPVTTDNAKITDKKIYAFRIETTKGLILQTMDFRVNDKVRRDYAVISIDKCLGLVSYEEWAIDVCQDGRGGNPSSALSISLEVTFSADCEWTEVENGNIVNRMESNSVTFQTEKCEIYYIWKQLTQSFCEETYVKPLLAAQGHESYGIDEVTGETISLGVSEWQASPKIKIRPIPWRIKGVKFITDDNDIELILGDKRKGAEF